MMHNKMSNYQVEFFFIIGAAVLVYLIFGSMMLPEDWLRAAAIGAGAYGVHYVISRKTDCMRSAGGKGGSKKRKSR